MTTLYITLAASVIGLFFGSFAGASVWRLRARQLVADNAEGEPVDAAELRTLKPLTKQSFANDRSRCLHCGHQLAWYDLIPLASWVSTQGSCRYCKKPIGRFEPLIELATAALFGLFTYQWLVTQGLAQWPILIVWLAVLVLLVILFVYDAKWFLLPDLAMFPLIGLGAVIATYQALYSSDIFATIISTGLAVVILSGIYLALWLYSKGEWIGFGDVKLGLALGLLLSNWQLAFLTLFLANLIGTLIVIPGLLTKKMTRKTQVPFGPLLIVGFFISVLYGERIVQISIEAMDYVATFMLML